MSRRKDKIQLEQKGLPSSSGRKDKLLYVQLLQKGEQQFPKKDTFTVFAAEE